MERWSIELSKEDFKFSAAHFLIFPDGSAERLHGHNYRVFLEVAGELSEFGLVIDFQKIKPVVRELLATLNERFLVPGEHRELRVKEVEPESVEITYRERRYVIPSLDVRVLPVNNTSTENLAAFLGREMLRILPIEFPDVRVRQLRLAVEETLGQRGVYEFLADE
ncbi:MAG: 6-pyruvoyltetrahydropterin/6-carboxytetrahydropterin synthase [Candidatus Paceibacteria bacterium]|jgi:6-pyruvoyltetrahydropterin/6-carboxytetrahydropterin synthase